MSETISGKGRTGVHDKRLARHVSGGRIMEHGVVCVRSNAAACSLGCDCAPEDAEQVRRHGGEALGLDHLNVAALSAQA